MRAFWGAHPRYVCFSSPLATELMRRGDPPLCAIGGSMHCSKPHRYSIISCRMGCGSRVGLVNRHSGLATPRGARRATRRAAADH
jgi:hypothetical protein